MEPQESSGETIKVELVNVEVRVLDKAGLQVADFVWS